MDSRLSLVERHQSPAAQSQSLWDRLAGEILHKVFILVGVSDSYNCSLVCSYWRDLQNDPVLWKSFYFNSFFQFQRPEAMGYDDDLIFSDLQAERDEEMRATQCREFEHYIRCRFKRQTTPRKTLDWKKIYRLTLEEIEEERVYNYHLFQALRPSRYYVDYINSKDYVEAIKDDYDDVTHEAQKEGKTEEEEEATTEEEEEDGDEEKSSTGWTPPSNRRSNLTFGKRKKQVAQGNVEGNAQQPPLVPRKRPALTEMKDGWQVLLWLLWCLLNYAACALPPVPPSASSMLWRWWNTSLRWLQFWFSSCAFLPLRYAPNRYTFFRPFHYATRKRRAQERLRAEESRRTGPGSNGLLGSSTTTTSMEHFLRYEETMRRGKKGQCYIEPEEGTLAAYYQCWRYDHTCLYNPINYLRVADCLFFHPDWFWFYLCYSESPDTQKTVQRILFLTSCFLLMLSILPPLIFILFCCHQYSVSRFFLMPWLLSPDWGVLLYLSIFTIFQGPLGVLFILIHYNENLAFAFTKGRKSELKLIHSTIFIFLVVVSVVSAILGSIGFIYRVLYVFFPFVPFTAASSFTLKYLTTVSGGGWAIKLSKKSNASSSSSSAYSSSSSSTPFATSSLHPSSLPYSYSFYSSLNSSFFALSPACVNVPWKKMREELQPLHRVRCLPSGYLLATVLASCLSLVWFYNFVPLHVVM